jgi:hypothetical protein
MGFMKIVMLSPFSLWIVASDQWLLTLVLSLQVFHLMPAPGGSFYVHNDMFRLNYG